jgi:hypothetical protein
MTYSPKPIETTGIALSDSMDSLTERLAENVHDLWARQRIADGWTVGPSRNDTLKEHPGLVPYAELPESEKDYDRTICVDTIKAILALGYKIEPPNDLKS